MKARSVGTFVQIGDMAINMALVVRINFNPVGPEGIYLHYPSRRGNTPTVLRGDERVAFLEWWERQAVQTEPQFVYATGSEGVSWPQ